MQKKYKTYILFNIVISLLSGLTIYLLFRSNTYIHRVLFEFFNIKRETALIPFQTNNVIVNFLSYYFVDGLWCYAFVFSLVAFSCRLSEIKIVLIGLFVFLSGVVLEVLQNRGFINGTFDWIDIAMYLIAATLAIAINLKIIRKGEKK